MKCSRCGKDECFLDLVPLPAKLLKPELGYRDLLGGGKNAFCLDCCGAVLIKGNKKYNEDGMRMTDCCGACSTFDEDGQLYCKACYYPVSTGEGDGCEYKEEVENVH